jgi:hypothetical protein
MVYMIIILKFWEWLIVNCEMNVIKSIFLGFYIFERERLRNDYIKFYKPYTYMYDNANQGMDNNFLIYFSIGLF